MSFTMKVDGVKIRVDRMGETDALDWFHAYDKVKVDCNKIKTWMHSQALAFVERIRGRYSEEYDTILAGLTRSGDVLYLVASENQRTREGFCGTVPAESVPLPCEDCQTNRVIDQINVRGTLGVS